jgi:two-component system nitrate/nitrite response regulator NarL
MVQAPPDEDPPQGRRTIKLIVVDDHDLFRTGLVMLLSSEDGIDVVGQASGGRTGVRLSGELRPDVVLMDVRMPDLSGPDATRQILQHDPSTRVLALTITSDDRAVAAAIDAGACGFLAKDTPIESLVAAIRAAASGAAWLSPKAAEAVFARLRAPAAAPERQLPALQQLSPRELEVLRLIAQGMENAEIALALSISPRTAKNHVSNILSKLGLPSRVQAAVFAVRQGVS